MLHWKNTLSKRVVIRLLALSFALALACTSVFAVALDQEQQGLAGKLIRLHIVAASNSDEDQSLKLMVRDAVLDQLGITLDGITTKEEAEEAIHGDLGELAAVSSETLQAQGCGDPVKASLQVEAFPTVNYDTFSLPAGYYTTLRIVIGSGQGHNWWCVVFPNLCTSAALGDEDSQPLTDEESAMITGDGYQVRFKAVELVEQFKEWIRGEIGE